MNAQPDISPVTYDASLEQREDDEDETIASLCEQLKKIMTTTAEDYGHAVRGVHAKSHGMVRGELEVIDQLPPILAQGLFAEPSKYQVLMRFSTNPGDIMDDSVSAPRGLAIKVAGVTGERLPGSEDAQTQDFVMANGPAFQSPNLKSFLRSLKLLAPTTDTPQTWKKAFSATLRGAESLMEKAGGQSSTLTAMGGQPKTHILGDTFYSQVPLLYGPYIAKVAVAPASQNVRELTGAPLDLTEKPDALRDAVVEFFRDHEAEWELRVQLCTNTEAMPVEDASAVWPEDQSPYVAVARIHVPAQQAWSEARANVVNDTFAFNPWHGLAAHRPLGSIMRARKPVYEMSARFRASHNNTSVHEPQGLDDLPA